MERIFGRGKVPPEEDMGPFKSGYFVKIFFVEDMGKKLNAIFPEKFRRTEKSVSGGGMTLADAKIHSEKVQAEWGTDMISLDGQAGWYKTLVVPEQLPDDVNRF